MDTITDYLLRGGYAESTRQRYRWILDRLAADTVDLETLSASDLLAWLDAHPTWGANMRRLALVTAQAYLRHTYGETHPALALRLPRVETPPGRTLTAEQVRQLYAALGHPASGKRLLKNIRDRALLSTLLDTGLRAIEICRLQIEHIVLHSTVPYLSALTKGGRWQTKIISQRTAHHLADWITHRGEIAAKDAHTVFVGVGGLTPGRPLTPDGLRPILRGWAQRAGIPKLSPHDFRRTAATLAAERGASDQVLMAQFGWRDPSMPRRYTGQLALRRFAAYSTVVAVFDDDPDPDTSG